MLRAYQATGMKIQDGGLGVWEDIKTGWNEMQVEGSPEKDQPYSKMPAPMVPPLFWHQDYTNSSATKAIRMGTKIYEWKRKPFQSRQRCRL